VPESLLRIHLWWFGFLPYSRNVHVQLCSMPVHVGIICPRCEKVFFPGGNTDQIEVNPLRGQPGLYRLTCTCDAVRFFGKHDMVPYSVSTHAYLRGYADRGQYQELRKIA
jgi:hypothetical protein